MEISDYQKIKKDVEKLHNNYWHYKISNFVCKINDDLIGSEKIRINHGVYFETYDYVNKNQLFCAELFDGSFVTFTYLFNKKGEIENFSLSFLPNPLSETLAFKNIDEEFNVTSLYFRVDCTEEGHNKLTHSFIHFHNNLFRDGLRIGVKKPLYPSQFIYDILINVLGVNEDDLQGLYHQINCNEELSLINNDILKMYISF